MTSLPILLAAVSRPQDLLAFQEKRDEPWDPPKSSSGQIHNTFNRLIQERSK